MLDAVLVKVWMNLYELFSQPVDSIQAESMEAAQELLKGTLKLIQAYSIYIRWVDVKLIKNPQFFILGCRGV